MILVAVLRNTIVCVFIGVLLAPVLGQTDEPRAATEYFQIGVQHYRERRFSDALDAFRKSAQLDPNQAATHGNIGGTLMELRRPAEAAAAFREAIRLAPRDGSFHTGLCGALIAIKNVAEAIAACETGVKLSPDSLNAQVAYATTLKIAGRPPAEIQRAIDLMLARFPENERIVAMAAEHYLGINLSYAAELIERVVRVNPSARNYAKLADVYLRLERETEAVAAARKALEIEPGNPVANYFMGRLFFELGLHEEAVSAFEKVVSDNEAPPDARYFLALSEATRGRPDAAITVLKAAVADDPDNFEYQLELGRWLNHQARYEDAVEPLQKAVNLKPKNVEAKVILGLALFESTQFAEAMAVLEEANRMRPGEMVTTMYLRVARARQQQIPRIDEMKQYANENTDDINVRVELVRLLSFARRLPEAEPYVQEILRLKPKEAMPLLHIAVAYSTAGKDEKALEIYRKSLEIEEHFGAYFGIAAILAERGQADEASRAYAKVIELKPDVPNIMILYANHLAANGKRREALNMYKRSLALLPMNGPALFSAAVLSAKLGEMDAARSYLESLNAADPISARKLGRYLRLLF